MPITGTTKQVARAINKLREALELQYGEDNYTYSITVNSGLTVAQHGVYGIEHPVPSVDATPEQHTKKQALRKLKMAIGDATGSGLFDDLTAHTHPDIINQFCDLIFDAK